MADIVTQKFHSCTIDEKAVRDCGFKDNSGMKKYDVVESYVKIVIDDDYKTYLRGGATFLRGENAISYLERDTFTEEQVELCNKIDMIDYKRFNPAAKITELASETVESVTSSIEKDKK